MPPSQGVLWEAERGRGAHPSPRQDTLTRPWPRPATAGPAQSRAHHALTLPLPAPATPAPQPPLLYSAEAPEPKTRAAHPSRWPSSGAQSREHRGRACGAAGLPRQLLPEPSPGRGPKMPQRALGSDPSTAPPSQCPAPCGEALRTRAVQPCNSRACSLTAPPRCSAGLCWEQGRGQLGR